MTLADVQNSSNGTQHVRVEGGRQDVEAEASSQQEMKARQPHVDGKPQDGQNQVKGENEECMPPPQWVSDFLDAATSGGNEFRKEARKLIKTGHGPGMQALLEDMAKKAPEESKEGVEKMVKCVQAWIEKPEEMEEGGRWWSYWDSNMFSNSWFSSFYMPAQMSWSWLPSSNQGGGRRTSGGQTTKYTSTW